MSTITIRVPESLKRELKRSTKQHGQSAGDVVRESLKRYLAVERFQALKRKTLPFAETQGYLTDEDVFKATS
jgi:Arc/MetJ-type ribon-helix-helix transcriptional regulator